MKKTGIAIIMVLGVFLSSCATNFLGKEHIVYTVVECPENVVKKALQYAQMYVARDTVYVWGGQDLLKKEGILEIDCSGLIVNCYQYATAGTKYSLMFNDTTVGGLHEYFTRKIDKPKPGDFIFMGGDTKAPPSHMSIFVRMDNENIYFIDATQKDAEGIYPAVDGVTERYYKINDPRFFYYARLLVKY